MALKVEHEIHQRRFGRNLGVGLSLVSFVALVLALTVVKVTRTDLAPHQLDGNNGAVQGTADPAKTDPSTKKE